MLYLLLTIQSLPSIDTACSFSCDSGYSTGDTIASNDSFEFTLGSSGNWDVSVFDNTYRIQPGQLLIYPPGVKRCASAIGEGKHHHSTIYMRYPYEYQILTEDQLCKQVNIFFETHHTQNAIYPLFYPVFPILNESQINDFINIINLYEENSHYSGLKANNLLLSWLISISEDQMSVILSNGSSVINKSVVQKMITFINENYQIITGLDYISKALNYNPAYLSSTFRKNLGTNPIDYLNRIRVEKAKKLIEQGNHSFQEIAYEVGVKNYYYFSRLFKKYTNLTMSQYQKMIYK